MTRSETDFLRDMTFRYGWDMSEPDAASRPEKIIRRVMDLGVLDDAMALERTLGRSRLAAILRASGAGAIRPRSWWFWHYRLGLADVDHDPPAMPVRSLG